jgi:hypothetical protein
MTIQQLCRENQIYKLKVIQLTKERQMLECDYNARLKADMAAMLTDLQLEIEENKAAINEEIVYRGRTDLVHFINGINLCLVAIERKINGLKENEK